MLFTSQIEQMICICVSVLFPFHKPFTGKHLDIIVLDRLPVTLLINMNYEGTRY